MGGELDSVRRLVVPVNDDGIPHIDSESVAGNAPEAVIDPGGDGWPVKHDDARLVPRLVLAVQELADQQLGEMVPDVPAPPEAVTVVFEPLPVETFIESKDDQ